jgi:hypothetical protein
MYSANMRYLNSSWVDRNIDRLFSKANAAAWKCAAQGFAYQNHFYEWLYRSLRDGGHLRRMLFDPDMPDKVTEKALQYIGIAYLEGHEKLVEQSLLSELVESLHAKELGQLTWFFWTLRGNQDRSPQRGPLILEFWQRVNAAIEQSGSTHPEVQSALNLLAVYITELTPALKSAWLAAAPHAQVRHHGYVLVEHMARLAPRHPLDVFEIFRAALTGFLPDFDKEDVVACVNAIARAGHAEWLCNEYFTQGSTLLKETYANIRLEQRTKPTLN